MSQSQTHTPNASLAICSPIASTGSLFQRIKTALMVARSRRALAKLDAAELADIGLTHEQAQIEVNRPIWDAPSHWAG
jgi:uncharacterized protein YjiS (DUF1127 family)